MVGSGAAMAIAMTTSKSAIVDPQPRQDARVPRQEHLHQRPIAGPRASPGLLQLAGVAGVSLEARGRARAGEVEREPGRSIGCCTVRSDGARGGLRAGWRRLGAYPRACWEVCHVARPP